MNLLKTYWPVIRFLLLFIGSYAVLTVGYQLYLGYGGGSGADIPDYVTHVVSEQTANLLDLVGYNAKMVPNPDEPAMVLYLNQRSLMQVVEGCNGVSVIILFISFVIAFHDQFKNTLLFALIGSLIVYGLNLVRLVILAIGFYKFPEYEEFLHNIVFPSIIYGTVFMLWVFWARYVMKSKTVKNG